MNEHSPRAATNTARSVLIACVFLALACSANAEETLWKDRAGKPAPSTESRKSKNDFGGWLLVTPDLDWKKKWETSPETVPHYRTSDVVNRGEKLFVLIFFVHPAVDGQGNADVTCDVESVRPDGTFSIRQKDVVCLRGKLMGNPYNIRLAPGVIEFTGEPKDPAGKWTVRVTIKDNRRRVVLPLKTSFTLK